MRWALRIGSIYGIAIRVHLAFLFLLAFLLSVGGDAVRLHARRATKVDRWWRCATSRAFQKQMFLGSQILSRPIPQNQLVRCCN